MPDLTSPDLRRKPNYNEPRHQIQVVARRTGLSADVIRVWERRYKVVSPHRSPTHRRLYSDADIQKLTILQRAIQAGGRRIGELAKLDESEILVLLSEDKAHQQDSLSTDEPNVDSAVGRSRKACISAIKQFDQLALEYALADALVELPVLEVLEKVISTVLIEVGKQWEKGSTRISHEHFATAIIRSFLGHLISTGNVSGDGPMMLIATPSGQNHEIGAMMAAVIAANDGWRVAYLSPNLPAQEIAAAVRQLNPLAIALGISYPPDDQRISRELETLRKHIPDNVALIIGGRAAKAYQPVINGIGAIIVNDLSEFRQQLKGIRSDLYEKL
ncbi:MerR family transcriptional regulator [Pseudomonadota bacterium]